MIWKSIDSMPNHGSQILVGFMGQFKWFSYVVYAGGPRMSFGSFATPTHWTEIQIPSKAELGEVDNARMLD